MGRKDNRFVLFVALAFWLWIGAPMVYAATGIHLGSGKLILSVIIVLILLLVAGNPKHTSKEPVVSATRLKSITPILLFLAYCAIHAFVSGSDYSIFKLQQLILNIVVAYVLSNKVVRAIHEDKIQFFFIGLLVGVLVYYSVFKELMLLKEAEVYLGIRAMRIGELVYQDYYVILILFAMTILFSSSFRFTHLILFVITVIFSLPIVILSNSRMIPFTIGVTILYLILKLRSVLVTRRNWVRNMIIIAIVVISGTMVAKDNLNEDMSMMRVFEEGPWQSFRYGYRYISFTKAAEDFSRAPVLGIGFGRFSLSGITQFTSRTGGTWAHNIFLELLAEMGLIGLLLFLYFAGRTFVRVYKVSFRSDQEFLVFPCLLIVYTIATMQLTHNLVYIYLWVGLFFCDAAFNIRGSISYELARSKGGIPNANTQ